MTTSSMRTRLLASSMISGVALAALSVTGAQAQAAAPAPAAAPDTAVSEVVVTGSRIPQPNITSTSPITVVGSQEAKLEGTTRVEDLLNNLPQVFAGQGGNISNGSSGTATVDLRGLGSSRTLVLIDGRRVMPGDPSTPVTDLNFIPSLLIDRVEVLTGGASATYGSDAIAGVVNFIMIKNFEGVRLDAQVSGYQHDNSNGYLQGLNKAKGYTAPSGSIWDGRQTDVTGILGVNSADGKGNITAYFGYRNIKPIQQNERDYSNCTLGNTHTGFVCKGSGTTPQGHIFSNDLANKSLPYDFIVDKTGAGNTLRTTLPTDVFNYAPYNYYQRPDERYSFGAFAHYEINPHADVYSQLMFMDDHTLAQIAPSGIFGQTFNIPCNSPLLSAQEVTTLCTNAGLTAAQNASVAILRRNVEGGPRIDNLRHTDYRVVVGVKGEITENWNYDVYGQIGRAVYAEEYLNEFSLRKTANALNAMTDANGNIVCAGNDAGCVPYLGVFSAAPPSAKSLAYIQSNGFKEGATTEMVVSGAINGTIPAFKSPWATDSLGLAFGGEYRQEQLDLRVSPEFDTGDLAGQGGPTHGVAGSYNTKEVFAETRIPIVQDMPFFKLLSVEAAYRFSHYNLAGDTNTYKVAGDWKPTDDIRFRASYQRAVRAPNIVELFTPQGVVLGVADDPCAGPVPEDTAAQCANTGVTAAQYGHIAKNPANQYNSLAGGSLNLKPEIGKSFTGGVVLTPRMIPGFSLSVDYFHIKVDNYIQALDPNITLTGCATTGNPIQCALVKRAPNNGSLWLGTNGFVIGNNVNAGFLSTSGVDFEAAYRLPLSNMGWENGGNLTFAFDGTYLAHLITSPGPTEKGANGQVYTQYDCVGLYGATTCGTPNPKWRHQLRVTWRTPVEGLEVSGAWRYFGSVTTQFTSANPFLTAPKNVFAPDEHLPAQNYFDLSAQYRLKDKITFRGGVRNIFDKQPPIVGSTTGGNNAYYNGNTYPNVYDPLGRYLFVGASVDF